ncbi:MAG: selenocysteine-specific translation elongation factor [Planctomycetota bacterium]
MARADEQTPDILPVMVGTAGHVDHGKTALVQHLTGCSLDRHPEAKARGLTIDLGFAPCRLPGNRMVGIIDVPGHEDFIRNMVAGAASIDILLLVVAADDGVMPQTREHLRIVRALRTARVIVAVTKIDLVDTELRTLMLDELQAFLAASGCADAPIHCVSNLSMEGIPKLRRALDAAIADTRRSPDPRAFRMHVERSFTVAGHGTVVTGIPTSGALAGGERVALRPQDSLHAVRAIQNYKHDSQRAVPGMCCAINLRDLDHDRARRGTTLTAPDRYPSTTTLVATLTNGLEADCVKRTSRLRLHAGTASVEATVKLLDAEVLAPGEHALARIALARPFCLAAGDRFILRAHDRRRTIGGGRVLSARARIVRRSAPGFAARMAAARDALADADLLLADCLAGDTPILSLADAMVLTQLPDRLAAEALAAACKAGRLTRLGGKALLVSQRIAEVTRGLIAAAERHHRAHPLSNGLQPSRACELVGVDAACWKDLARALAATGELVVRHGRLARSGFAPALTAKQAQGYTALSRAVAEAGMAAPAIGDLKRQLGITVADLKLLAGLLVEEGLAIRFGQNLMDAACHAACRRALLELFTEQDDVGVKQFRDATDVSRNLAIALLEGFDAEGLTRREGDARVLIR